MSALPAAGTAPPARSPAGVHQGLSWGCDGSSMTAHWLFGVEETELFSATAWAAASTLEAPGASAAMTSVVPEGTYCRCSLDADRKVSFELVIDTEGKSKHVFLDSGY